MNIGNNVRFKDGFMENREFTISSVNGRFFKNGEIIPVADIQFKVGGRVAVFRHEPQKNIEVVKE